MPGRTRAPKRGRQFSLIAAAVGVAALVSDVAAQGGQPRPSGGKPSAAGEYGGVKPGTTTIVPPGAPWKRSKWAPMFWVGFQPRDGGGSRVFIQLGREVEYDQRIEKGELVVTLDRTRFANRNAGRPIITRFFEGAVSQVAPRRVRRRKGPSGTPGRRGGVEIRVQFKNPADLGQASATLSREQDGFVYLYLDFGPGSEAEPEEVADEPTPDLDDSIEE